MSDKCKRCRRDRKPPRAFDCEVCGRQFLNRWDSRTCSPECRSRKNYVSAKSDGRADAWRATQRERLLASRVERPCGICGEPLPVGKRKLCGKDECLRRHNAQRMGKFVQARRAAKCGAECESFDPREVFERDSWMCGICALPVDPTERWPAPGAATLDHVIPLARGGAHSRANTQLAHAYCNSVKGARSTAA